MKPLRCALDICRILLISRTVSLTQLLSWRVQLLHEQNTIANIFTHSDLLFNMVHHRYHRGLGRSIAEEVMRRGGRVAGTVRNLAHADQLKKQFPDRLWIRSLDLSDLANIANVFQAAVEHFGRVHAVVSFGYYDFRFILSRSCADACVNREEADCAAFVARWREVFMK